MARIRTVKPDAWHDELLGTVSRDARLLWVVLITMADDEGRFRSTPSIVQGHGYPYDTDALALLPGWLDELARVGLIVLYGAAISGRPAFGAHPRWHDHQRISKPSPSKFPAPPENPQGFPGEPAAPQETPGKPSPRADAPEWDKEGEEERDGRGAPPPASAPAHEAPPAPQPAAALTCPVEVRDMLLAAGFNPGEIEQADGAIRLTLNQLKLPDDVDWWRYGREINQAREDGKLRRHGPIAALRFIAKGVSGPPRLKTGQRRGTAASPVDHYAAMRDAA